jgi:aminocarboxymuconate-semialdehyde decarboxylase
VHAHLFPQGLPDFAARHADPHWPNLVQQDETSAVIVQDGEVYRRVDASYWAVEPRLAWMDEVGVDRQVVSPLPILLTYWAPPAAAMDYARRQNEAIAAFVAGAPDRLLGFGTVPLQDPTLSVTALEEIQRLGLAGVEIGSHAGGMEFDRPELRPFFEAAASLGLPVFLHALEGEGLGRVDNHLVRFGIGVPADTGLTAAYLLSSGLLHELPALRLCLSHGGGSFFWSLPRIRRLLAVEQGKDRAEELVAAIRRVYVDTAGLDHSNVGFLLGQLSPDRLLVGSDYPAARRSAPLACLDGPLPSPLRHQIAAANASSFLGEEPAGR